MNSKEFYISHFTTLEALVDIVKIGSLLPLCDQKSLYGEKCKLPKYYDTVKGIGDLDKYDKSIFYSIIFLDNSRLLFKPNPGKIYLIFPPKILTGRISTFCKGWSYGKIENVMKIEDYFSKTIHPDSGTYKNELLVEGTMKLDSLIHIYVPKNRFFDPLILEKLISENPNLPWIRENPFEK